MLLVLRPLAVLCVLWGGPTVRVLTPLLIPPCRRRALPHLCQSVLPAEAQPGRLQLHSAQAGVGQDGSTGLTGGVCSWGDGGGSSMHKTSQHEGLGGAGLTASYAHSGLCVNELYDSARDPMQTLL